MTVSPTYRRVKVWRGRSLWWWWCPCCIGGDWYRSHSQALAAAVRHAERADHSDA